MLEAEKILIGAVEQDSSGYPDCRPSFYRAYNEAIKAGTKDGTIEVITPLIGLRKSQIVTLGLELGAPFDLTWSCYSREDRACGVCDSCVLRLRAFETAGARDPISYVTLGNRSYGTPDFRRASAVFIAIIPGAEMSRRAEMKRFTSILLALVAVAVIAPATWGTEVCTVKGTVKDENGKPQPNATVQAPAKRLAAPIISKQIRTAITSPSALFAVPILFANGRHPPRSYF